METAKENLLMTIESYRQEMIKLGFTSGLNSAEIVKISQALDKLIIKYQQLLY
ncbi:Spo0E family sporulation regulatory protein-aspartic acid phosphatase [Bacillus sp. JJ1122]|uniref:Spo0E family sporulation regulatory protein-aspartic acid phosphatase n=1 Tax=Bacillus sp. JJ1122 TaxID=3122951 RepID=UPI003F68A68D